MLIHYIEHRKQPDSQTGALATDIAKHLQARQYLGRALVICDNPNAVLSAVRKQWLKAARQLLKLRASTLNAEEILRLTHVIMHMQTIQFIAKLPNEVPGATVYFASPESITPLPTDCYSVYCIAQPSAAGIQAMATKLPEDTLLISYVGELHGLQARPKAELEHAVLHHWQIVVDYLISHDVHPNRLVVNNTLQFGPMDDALDILLGVADGFLRRAAGFQRAINLAQPFTSIAPEQQKVFEAVTRLAHRVQDLTPGNFNHYLVGSFDDSTRDAFFLRDVGSELYRDLENAAQTATK